MLGSLSRHCGSGCKRQLRNRDLQVCWANVAKNTSCHITILHVAFTEKMDVICVQEPASYPGTKTQNHPGYDCYAPVDSWASTDPDHPEAERPRVMTYIRKGAAFRTQQRRPIHCRDVLSTDATRYATLNAYHQPPS